MKKRRITLEESQRASLEILKAVIKLCDRLQLNYWITYGTLLGAIRHGGFIPWDDDLDIAMKREEYDILINYIITHKNECYPLVVHNKYTVKNCFYNISRICDTRYLLEFKDYDYVSGVFVDIYPYEALGDEKRYAEWMKWFRRNTKIKKFINMSCSKSYFYG